MASDESQLLALPDPCLVLVLQLCAADSLRSVFSAARAHSRLHQAAKVAMRSFSAQVSHQQQMDGVMVYLGKQGEHVNSLKVSALNGPLSSSPVQLLELPQQLQLSGLQCNELSLQLLPGNGSQGVLGIAATVAALKQLQLHRCEVVDDRHDAAAALTSALSQLPAGLEHLSIDTVTVAVDGRSCRTAAFPVGVLQQLQHLTHLELVHVDMAGPNEASTALQALTRLVSLMLAGIGQVVVTRSMLSGMQHLTCLTLVGTGVEPGCLAGKTRLQHLAIAGSCLSPSNGGAVWVAQLLSHLQPLQQLTYLNLMGSLENDDHSDPPASAYAALTASSKLKHLLLSGNTLSSATLPTGVWQHIFPAGRHLPDLQELRIREVRQPEGGYAQAPASGLLLSCCPGLQDLNMPRLINPELALVQGLGRLHSLDFDWDGPVEEAVQAVCHIAGLRSLRMSGLGSLEEGLLLPLTQLRQLTVLRVDLHNQDGGVPSQRLELANWRLANSMEGGDEPVWQQPVWQQLLQLHQPGAAQQAAAALAGLHM